jgi:hypothetical protein
MGKLSNENVEGIPICRGVIQFVIHLRNNIDKMHSKRS